MKWSDERKARQIVEREREEGIIAEVKGQFGFYIPKTDGRT